MPGKKAKPVSGKRRDFGQKPLLILTSSMKSKTLPLAISDFKGEYTMNVPLIMTVLTLCAIPMIIAFCIGQDKLVKGMMAGAVKG